METVARDAAGAESYGCRSASDVRAAKRFFFAVAICVGADSVVEASAAGAAATTAASAETAGDWLRATRFFARGATAGAGVGATATAAAVSAGVTTGCGAGELGGATAAGASAAGAAASAFVRDESASGAFEQANEENATKARARTDELRMHTRRARHEPAR